MAISVSVIMPVWNQSGLTDMFFRQHTRYMSRKDIEFVVVNNGSTDNTAAVLARWGEYFPRIVVVSLEDNVGFAAGNNIGARAASGSIFLFTQNDVRMHGDYITIATHKLHEYGDKTIIGARYVTRGDGWNTFNGTVVKYLQGWFVGMWREDWEFIGGFDEQFSPCDFEDVDLSYRAVQVGYSLREVKLPIRHSFGGTTRQLDRLRITTKNRELFAKKWGLSCT